MATRTPTFLIPPVVVDRASSVPLHRQLRHQLASAVRTSPAGTRLPSTRVLARLLGVSRNTVLAVYDDLAADGLIEGRRGAAMVVAGRAAPPGPLAPEPLFRDAGYPARTVVVEDGDGNPVSLTY